MTRQVLIARIAIQTEAIRYLEERVSRTAEDLLVLCRAVDHLPPEGYLNLTGVIEDAPEIKISSSTDRGQVIARLTDIYNTRRFRLTSERDWRQSELAKLQSELLCLERSEVTNARRSLSILTADERHALFQEFKCQTASA